MYRTSSFLSIIVVHVRNGFFFLLVRFESGSCSDISTGGGGGGGGVVGGGGIGYGLRVALS